MWVAYSDHHVVELPEGHRFPMGKYALLRRTLVERGVVSEAELVPSEPSDEVRARIEAVHSPTYVRAVFEGTLEPKAVRRLGLPWSEALVRRSCASVAGTLEAARVALVRGFAGNLAGGTHHAFADGGAGYCVWNDIAVAARALLDDRAVARVLVVDLDVHQGDGTAAIFRGDDRVFTLSLHGEKNFPFVKQKSDLDVELPDGTDDLAYLMALRQALDQGLRRARPELVFFQAGVDALAGDTLGRLALSHDGLKARDELVLETCRRLALPVVTTLGGGYTRPIDATIDAHVGTYEIARAVFG